MSEGLITLTAGVAIAIGVIGTLVPVLPGVALVWVSQLIYGVFAGFGILGAAAIAISTVLAGVAVVMGVRIPQRSAAAEGVSTGGQLLGAVLAVIGFFLIPVVGAPLGFTVGVWLHRLRYTGDPRQAWRSTIRTIRSLVRASIVQFGAALGMAFVWGLWALLD